jgi:hypothetical protein
MGSVLFVVLAKLAQEYRSKFSLGDLDPEIVLAPLWQIDLLWLFTDSFFAVWAFLLWRSKNEIDDGLAHRWQAWLRRRSVDFFRPARARRRCCKTA